MKVFTVRAEIDDEGRNDEITGLIEAPTFHKAIQLLIADIGKDEARRCKLKLLKNVEFENLHDRLYWGLTGKEDINLTYG